MAATQTERQGEDEATSELPSRKGSPDAELFSGW